MMHDMPRPRPPYLSREVTRHGNAVWYVASQRQAHQGYGRNTARRNSTPSIRRR